MTDGKKPNPETYYLFVLTILNFVRIGFVEPVFWYRYTGTLITWVCWFQNYPQQNFLQITIFGFNIAIKTRTP